MKGGGVGWGLALVLGAAACHPKTPPTPRALPLCRDAWAGLPADYDLARDGQPTPEGNRGYAAYAARVERRACRKPWSVLVYMAADNDLAPYAYLNLYEMEAAPAPAVASTGEATHFAKPENAAYQPGKRAMLKIKHARTADCVVAGFRWHTKGPNQVVYCGSSRALCQLEKRVHANGANPKNQALMRLEIPAAASLIEVETLGLPADWRDDETATQTIGNTWVASGASLGLWVPSYIEPGERNLLIDRLRTAKAA